MINTVTAIILALGLLPSFTALSATLVQVIPQFSRYLGPINFLKIGAPILLLFFWTRRREFSDRFWVRMFEVIFALSLGTAMAAMTCNDPPVSPAIFREYSVILLGGLAALCFLRLPQLHQKGVMGFWLFAVYGGAVLDAFFPAGATWLYDHIFDPKTRDWDLIELGRYPLTGIFGRQSLAKMMAWLPWIAMAVFRPKRLWPWLAFMTLSTASILATTQRGPLVGALVGWGFFILHQLIQLRQTRVARWSIAALVAVALIAPWIVPQDILISRVKSLVYWKDPKASGDSASGNISYRFRMTQFSVKIIKDYPWGNACISTPTYWIEGLMHAGHSHNLIVQQYRERGWIWGSIHLLLWIMAIAYAWRSKHYLSSPLLAGVVSALVSGMFDHPWFVLNQSLVLWLLLLMPLLSQKEELET